MMLLIFKLDNWQCALNISSVDRVYNAVAITPLPQSPDSVLGLIDVHGSVLPVANIRKRFHLPDKNLAASDQLIIAQTARRRIAIVVDSIPGVTECGEHDIISSGVIFPGLDYVEGVLQTKSGLVLVHDLDRFFSLEEECQLEHAMSAV